MNITGSGATETVVQTENEGPFRKCSIPIDRELLSSIHWYASSPVRDASFGRTFCFRLCVLLDRGVSPKVALDAKTESGRMNTSKIE